MANWIIVKKKLKKFNKTISVNGDKSISIRWVLLASLANGVSTAKNLLMSEDVEAAIKAIKKLGIKVNIKNKICKIYGSGLNGYKYKKNLTIDAQNSGTLGRLLLGLLVDTKFPMKIIGDKSLSKRDFSRVTEPLKKFGVKIQSNKNLLPVKIFGSKDLKSQYYIEKKGSAQCKSSIMFAALKTPGLTIIKAKKSRDHSERMFRNLKLPINLKKNKNYDLIKINGLKEFNAFDYTIPGDISSAAFFIVLTALSKNSEILIKNININQSRVGIISILKKMGVTIVLKNKRTYKGEKIADIKVKSAKNIKSINCPKNINSSTIDEFLVIFLVAAKAKGVSYFKGLNELNQKESPRLIWGSKILSKMGIKNVATKNSIKIYGNPGLKINKKIIIKDYLKDHRVFMASVIAALSFGGVWSIGNPEAIKTSFPNFLKIINQLKK